MQMPFELGLPKYHRMYLEAGALNLRLISGVSDVGVGGTANEGFVCR